MIIYGNCCCFIWHWHKRLGFRDSVTFAWHASRITFSPTGCELHPRGWHFLWLTFLGLISEQPHSDPENTDSISTSCQDLCSAIFLSSTISTQFIQVCALIWPSGYVLKHWNLLYACCNQVNLINNVKAHSQYINYMNYLYCPYSVYVYYINKNIYVEVVCMWLTMMKLKSVNLCGLNCEYIVLTTVLLKIQGPDTSCEMNWLTYIHFPHWEIKNQYNEICKRILSVSY